LADVRQDTCAIKDVIVSLRTIMGDSSRPTRAGRLIFAPGAARLSFAL